jgi:3,4-dihydroxy 2-butanone 4-phosphate synthase
VFPLIARPGGVLQRRGHTEAAVELATLAGFSPAGVLCELMNPDGSMMRGEQLTAYASNTACPC